MALVFGDRVYETSTTTGNGTLTLAGIGAANYRTFSDVIGNGNTCYYSIVHRNANEWEVGVGTVSAGALARTTVLKTSAGNTTKIVFSAGTKDVFCDMPAERIVSLDAAGALTLTGVAVTAGAASFTTGAFSGAVTATAAAASFIASVGGADAQQIRMRMSGTNGVLDMTRNSGTVGELIFGIDATECARFDSGGNLKLINNLTVGASTFVVTAATGAVLTTGTFSINGASLATDSITNYGGNLTINAASTQALIFQTNSVTRLAMSDVGVCTFAGALAITGALTGVTTLNMSGALTTNGGVQTFGANDSGGAGYRLVLVPNV